MNKVMVRYTVVTMRKLQIVIVVLLWLFGMVLLPTASLANEDENGHEQYEIVADEDDVAETIETPALEIPIPIQIPIRDVAPPIVNATINGRLLNVVASDGFYAVEAIVVNGIRFNHRVNSALVVDVGEYMLTGQTIVVYAEDFQGNQSNVLMIDPPPLIPVADNVLTEHPTLTPQGSGLVVDVISDNPLLEHFTFQTRYGNWFHMIVDRNRDGSNVYLLSQVSEVELLTLAEATDQVITMPLFAQQPTNQEPADDTDENGDYSVPPHMREQENGEQGEYEEQSPMQRLVGRLGIFALIVVGGAVFAYGYFTFVVKKKKNTRQYDDSDDDNDGDYIEGEVYNEDNEDGEEALFEYDEENK